MNENWFSDEQLRDGLNDAQRVYDKLFQYFLEQDDVELERINTMIDGLSAPALRAMVHVGNAAVQFGISAAIERQLDMEMVFG